MRFSHVAAAAISVSGLFAAAQAQASVAISADPTQNMSCLANVCTPTAADAVLNAGDLAAMLASGNTVVATTGTGVEAGDLRVTAPVSWTAATLLTLVVHRATVFASPVNVGGNGGVAILTGTRDGVPALSFAGGASLSFAVPSDVLTINATRYKLEDNLNKLARAVVAHPGGAFALSQSVDVRFQRVYSASPIAVPFSGKFTGLGHVISGLRIADMAGVNVGVFSSVLPGGTLANLGTEKSVVAGTQSVGGLVGLNRGTVSDLFTSGTVEGVGANMGSFNLVGGVVGDNAGTVAGCRSEARATGGYASGGLVGENEGTVARSFAAGNTTAIAYAGGLVGWNSGNPVTASGTIVDSYATGKVRGKSTQRDIAGGLVGWNPGFGGALSSVATSYSTGTVGSNIHGSLIGGFIGHQVGTAMNDYWDTTTSARPAGVGDGDAAGITGLTTAQFLSGLPAGFDPAVWGQSPSVNAGYPYLLDNPPQ